MKICLAQTLANKGNVQKNIQNHLQLIKRAIFLNADVVIFPELSITSYEPTLAKVLSTTLDDTIFNPFQDLSNTNEITIGVGMPIKTNNGIQISMLIFQPNQERSLYSKQLLHADELPYFTSGTNSGIITIKDKKLALGICYETLQREHFLKANKNGADLYIASVAKSKEGIDKATKYFSKLALEFNTPILMANSIGYCDNFLSVGQTSIWNSKGTLIEHLDHNNQGLLMFDTEFESAEMFQTSIEKGQVSNAEALFQIYLKGKQKLEQNGIYQWSNQYPTLQIIENDLSKGLLYTLKNNNDILGAIQISEVQEPEYQSINWEFNPSKVLVIHRLVIHPKHQKQGFGHQLMAFAEQFAIKNKYTTIRLDVYSQNKSAIEFYKNRDYIIRGDVNFPDRAHPFHCMEKEIVN